MNNIAVFTYKTTFFGGLGIQVGLGEVGSLGMEFHPVCNEQ